MFDNFGLGEFFFLALLALLFFGPDRLPQIGARFGRWVASLTQYSKAFMTEWREEALVIHDAVEEVRGIRDEIVAARAEISSTLETAREDMTEGLDVAKEAISDVRSDVTQRIERQREEAMADLDRVAQEEAGESSASGSGEEVAIAKTQEILAKLQEKREGAADTTPEETEWERTRRLIEEGLKARDQRTEAQDVSSEATSLPSNISEPQAATSTAPPSTAQTTADETTAEEAETAPVQPRESAFDRTQQILDGLQKRRSGVPEKEPPAATAPVEPQAAESSAGPAAVEEGSPIPAGTGEAESSVPPRESAFDRTQQILDGLHKRRSAKAAPDIGANERDAATVSTIDPSEFKQLSEQVVHLQDDLEVLRQELRALKVLAAQSVSAVADETDRSVRNEMSIEEAA